MYGFALRRGRGGVKSLEKLRTYYMDVPLYIWRVCYKILSLFSVSNYRRCYSDIIPIVTFYHLPFKIGKKWQVKLIKLISYNSICLLGMHHKSCGFWNLFNVFYLNKPLKFFFFLVQVSRYFRTLSDRSCHTIVLLSYILWNNVNTTQKHSGFWPRID